MDQSTYELGGLKDYLAGALVANAPMWVLIIAVMLWGTRESSVSQATTLWLGTMACGALAGRLVARKIGSANKVGMLTGLFSYIIFAIFLGLVGFRGEMIEETSCFTGFMIGSLLGARSRERRTPTNAQE